MKIALTSVMVTDQAKALAFYTKKLGFVKQKDIPMGGGARWLTVVSPEGAKGVELLLEPMGFAPARKYQQALFKAGIPAAAFAAKDVKKEYAKLKKRGVVHYSAHADGPDRRRLVRRHLRQRHPDLPDLSDERGPHYRQVILQRSCRVRRQLAKLSPP
jgi:catechol 2,3-dioxygenase-like lactoylglutathione lyase family enzyme